MRNNHAKAKDFKGSFAKLLKYIRPYYVSIILSIILVIAGTICTLIGPNKLSEITKIVQKGLSVSVTLSDQELDKLKTDNNITLEFNGNDLPVYYNSETDSISIIPFGEISCEELSRCGYIEFENTPNDVSLALEDDNGDIKIWFNTKTKIDIEKVLKICLTLVVIYLVSLVANFAQGYIMATVNQKVSKDLRTDISDKINKLPLAYFDQTTYGNVLSIVTNDVDTISQTLNNSIGSLIGSIALFLGALIMMFVTNWIMAISGILATLFGFGLMVVIIKRSQKHFIAQQSTLGKVNGIVEEAYAGQEIIKAYNAEQETIDLFKKENKNLYSSSWKSQFYSGLMQPLMGFIGNFGYVVVCVVGAVLVHKKVIDFSVIISIMIYIRLFSQPLAQVAQSASNLQSTAAASERVFGLLEQEELSVEPKEIENGQTLGNVEFKNVKFGYNPKKIIIKDFSANVKSGQKVAIVGPTGAGKTTLVNLLMKFYDMNSGDIIIDGISIKQLTRAQVHNMFSMVLQDTWLFQGTIKENLRYNKTNITDSDIEKACVACGIDHFIKTLPHGYDTVLDDNTSISAGQKQLLTIARAMLNNAPMLILDEATSSVDTRTEILIQQAMDKLMANRTSFVIAHRLSTIKNADMILVLKDGDIVEQGNHEQLLKLDGFYASLYNSQFEEVE